VPEKENAPYSGLAENSMKKEEEGGGRPVEIFLIMVNSP